MKVTVKSYDDSTLLSKGKISLPLNYLFHLPPPIASEKAKVGKWKYYNNKGQIEKIEHYKKGELHGKRTYYIIDNRGKKHAMRIQTFKNGKMTEMKTYSPPF